MALEGVGFLIWRHPGHRLEMTANLFQLVGILLGAPVALVRLRPAAGTSARKFGVARIRAANAVRRLANRWRMLLAFGFAVVSLSFLLFLLAVTLHAWFAIKPLAWLFLTGATVGAWAWWAALAPRRLRTPLPPSVSVVTPLAAADNPRAEAALALTAVACFVLATVLQLAAIYQS